MSDNAACNCSAWGCTCNATWKASSGRFCHIHGTPHPKGLMRLWQKYLYWREVQDGR